MNQRLQYQFTSTNVSVIDVSNIRLTRLNARVLSDVVRSYQCIENLNASNCDLDGEDAVMLARALRRHRSVKCVNLEYNRIRDVGACALAESLKSVKSLERMHLHGNWIGAYGKAALQNVLPHTAANITGLGLNNGVPRRWPMLVFMEAEDQETPAGAFVRACGDRGVLSIVLNFLV